MTTVTPEFFEFGDIVTLLHINRNLIYIGTFTLAETTYKLFFPISYSILFASNEDFICLQKDSKNPIMIEFWNPLFITSDESVIKSSSVDPDYINALLKFSISFYSNQSYAEKKFYTGPPITSNTDIRLLFKQEEKSFFSQLNTKFSKFDLLIPLIFPSI